MTASSDSPGEMRGLLLDQDTADRMLAGLVDPDDAPPGYAEVAEVLQAVGTPPPPDPVEVRSAVAAAVRLVNEPLARAHAPWTRRSSVRARARSRFFRAKIAGLVVVGTLAATTGLAAAGVLPDAAQHGVATVLSKVGITIPAAGQQPTDVSHPASTGEEISHIATTTDATGVAKGAAISSVASGGMSRAGSNGGGSGGGAPVTTPNTGGTGTANQASGGKADTGTTKADTASQGHSSAGSENAAGHKP